MTTTFKQDHDALTTALRDFVQILRTGKIDAMPEITRRRIAFAQLFRDHMGREDAAALALRKGPMAIQAEPFVRDHSRAMVALFLRYSDHLKFWTTAEVIKDMPKYCNAIISLQQELFHRMAWEERYLHPLIEGLHRKAA